VRWRNYDSIYAIGTFPASPHRVADEAACVSVDYHPVGDDLRTAPMPVGDNLDAGCEAGD
jgi:hypothetical protein